MAARRRARNKQRSPQMTTGSVTSVAALSAAVGISTPTLYIYRKSGCPVNKVGGAYDVAAVRDWLALHKRSKSDATPTVEIADDDPLEIGDPPDKEVEDACPHCKELRTYDQRLARRIRLEELRNKTEQAKERTMKNAINEGEYISHEAMKERDIARCNLLRSHMLGCGRRLASELVDRPQREIKIRIDTFMRNLLEQFSRM